MPVLATFEVFHSRPIAPTRRVALGFSELPMDPAPGFGGLLLGAVVGAHISALDDEMAADLHVLMDDVQRGRTIKQPRLRHRFQVDRIGLASSTHRLLGDGDELRLDVDTSAPSSPQVLAAVYEVGRLDYGDRPAVMDVLRRATAWVGDPGPTLIRFLGQRVGSSAASWGGDPVSWARGKLGIDGEADRTSVQRRFRQLLVEAHPDHGGDHAEAAARIEQLTEARRILLAATA